MTIVSEILDVISKVETLLKKLSIVRFNRWIRTIAALLIVYIWFNCLNTMPFPWEAMPLWGNFLGNLVNRCFFIAVLYAVISFMSYLIISLPPFILENFESPNPYIAQIASWVAENTSTILSFHSVMEALLDFVSLLFSLYYLLFAGNLFVEFCNGNSNLFAFDTIHLIGSVYTIYFITCIVLRFVIKRYKYYESTAKIMNKATRFVDSNGDRIYQDDTVIYNGKMYKVKLDERENHKSKKYVLSWQFDDECVLLEDALLDKDGKVIIKRKNSA